MQHGDMPHPCPALGAGSTYLWGALLELSCHGSTSGQAEPVDPVAAAALALGALQAQLPDLLQHKAGPERQISLCSPLISLQL